MSASKNTVMNFDNLMLNDLMTGPLSRFFWFCSFDFDSIHIAQLKEWVK